MSRPVIAWDLETCPQPLETLSPRQERRLALLVAWECERDPALSEAAASAKVRSLHPALGWICCLSAVAAETPDAPRAPRSYTAATPRDEAALLAAFWNDVRRFPSRV